MAERMVDLAELTRMCGEPAHEQSAVQSFTAERYGHVWPLSEAREIARLWKASK